VEEKMRDAQATSEGVLPDKPFALPELDQVLALDAHHAAESSDCLWW